MGTTIKQITQNQLSKEILLNEIIKSLSIGAKFGNKQQSNSGLYFYYYGGTYTDTTGSIIEIDDGSILCVANSTNYIEYNTTTKLMEVNQTGFTTGKIAIATAITSGSAINTLVDKRILALVPTGTSPLLGGGGGGNSTPAFGDITVTDNSISNPRFTIKGGLNWQPNRIKNNTSQQTVADYSSTSFFTALNSNSIYYVVFDPYYNNFSVIPNSSLASTLINVKIMHVITTDSTTFSIKDYRAQNYFQKNKTLMGVYGLGTSTTAHSFNMSQYYYFNQVANNEVLVTGAGASGYYPRFVRAYSTLLCTSAEHGYNEGEEADYITSDGTYWGKPLAIRNNGNITAFQGNTTKVWKESTGTYETITTNKWAIVVKVELDYQ